jgi:hypothetical protein
MLCRVLLRCIIPLRCIITQHVYGLIHCIISETISRKIGGDN